MQSFISGIKQAEYFVKFAESFLYPLQPLYTEKQVNEFTVQSDVSTVNLQFKGGKGKGSKFYWKKAADGTLSHSPIERKQQMKPFRIHPLIYLLGIN